MHSIGVIWPQQIAFNLEMMSITMKKFFFLHILYTVQKFGVCKNFYLFQINGVLFNFLFIKTVSHFYKKYQAAYLFSTWLIIRNVSKQHIQIISEGSCDTEDWSNVAENSALITGINYILKSIAIDNSCFKP